MSKALLLYIFVLAIISELNYVGTMKPVQPIGSIVAQGDSTITDGSDIVAGEIVAQVSGVASPMLIIRRRPQKQKKLP